MNVTWDQAEILNLRPAGAFSAVGIPPATVRWWASIGLIRPVATGPRGNKLYLYDDVIRVHDRTKKRPGRHHKPAFLPPSTKYPTLG